MMKSVWWGLVCVWTQPVLAFVGVKKISSGYSHTCALLEDGRVKCWGYNNNNQLGTGDYYQYGAYPASMGVNLPAVNLGNKVVATDVCASDQHSCVVTKQGKVKCWGGNNNGVLGQGSEIDHTEKFGDDLPYSDLGKDFFATKIVCGNGISCAMNSRNQVKCWGTNSGILGIGDSRDRGLTPGDMGDNLPYVFNGRPLSYISSGVEHVCAVTDGELRCWGTNYYGQLGQESTVPLGDSPETVPAKIPAIKITNMPKKIVVLGVSAGNAFACAWYRLQNSDAATHIKCWGNNDYGNLGTGTSSQYRNTRNTMGDHLPEVDLALNDIIQVETYRSHACALSKLGKIKCWGEARLGGLGSGDSRNRGSETSEMGKNLQEVNLGLPARALSRGSDSFHTCAILVNSQVKCWGLGGDGQLGYESNVSLGANQDDMGENLDFVRVD